MNGALERRRYEKPPITEAVIELRFDKPQTKKAIEAAAGRLKRHYVSSETELNIQFTFEVQDRSSQEGKIENQWNGLKLSSADRADIVLLRTTGISTCRLAPYLGWEAFVKRAQANWLAWKREGPAKLGRVGIRYINRIDVPDPGEPFSVDDYVLVTPRLPERDWKPMTAYVLQVNRPLGEDQCTLTINAGTVTSPMLNTFSFLLDIDIYRELDLPQRDNELWALVNRIREYKNSIFELCITDRARELFDR